MALNDYENIISSTDVTRGSRIDPNDTTLILSGGEYLAFGNDPNDIMVIRLYDRNDNQIGIKFSRSFPDRDPQTGYFMVNPKSDIKSFGYSNGKYKIEYLFWRFVIGNNNRPGIFIQEVSPSRTEVRVLPNNDVNSTTEFNTFKSGILSEVEAKLFSEELLLSLDSNILLNGLSDTFRGRVKRQFNITDEQLKTLLESVVEDATANLTTLLVNRGLTTLAQLNVILNTAIKNSIQQNFNL